MTIKDMTEELSRWLVKKGYEDYRFLSHKTSYRGNKIIKGAVRHNVTLWLLDGKHKKKYEVDTVSVISIGDSANYEAVMEKEFLRIVFSIIERQDIGRWLTDLMNSSQQ